MGRGAAVQIQLILDQEQLSSTLEMVRLRFKGTGLCFWASELSVEGVVE